MYYIFKRSIDTYVKGEVDQVFRYSREHVQAVDNEIDMVVNIREVDLRLVAHVALDLHITCVLPR